MPTRRVVPSPLGQSELAPLKIETFSHSASKGWSVASFPALDSRRTVVVAFGASGYLEDPSALAELARAYPSSCIVGCSTSGEIFGTRIEDGSLSVAVLRF